MTGTTTGTARAARAARTAVAAEVFRRHDVDFAIARRAAGWTNATWLGGGLAVRVAGSAAAQDLVRETRLARLLPAEVGYPAVLDSGETNGFEWVVTREIAAVSLDEAWPDLDGAQRVAAIRRLWDRAEAAHRVAPAAVEAVARPRNPFYAREPAEAEGGLRRLRASGVLTAAEHTRLSAALDRFWEALPDAPRVLNHGDLSPVNALWDGTDVVALLDFEFAVLAPVQLDVNELVKTAYAPLDGEPATREREDRERLREAVDELARPHLRTDAEVDLLTGYSIQLETWGLERELAKPGREAYPDWEPYRMLVSWAHTDGGCYAPLLEHRFR
ncbi:aminoglycoside phosphotransferase family protein [Streptomyces griseus]|uniref:phosphotransferase family protein n=1 Tax=Streptomyces TaxID=1883 RepID=UPI0004C64A30|nr:MULTISPECIES: aminoglycoside phosphotransferase family protein [Streptomyces]MYR10750.1 phosphotransferase [Streptomyces sp. SID724]MYT82957.1 phosphotransferase [Streptomyces sp. SID8364]SBU95078.1 scyllo-inosamine 4-kinase [Streptomyces sp. MnatMP-M77]SCE62064.1 scyllo-inosamine 4-kinase [Streptomyces sp. OspMP-M43]